MDSNSCLCNENLNAIKQEIDSGNLTQDEICRRLSMAINIELSKPFAEINQEYVTSCQNLLNSLLNIESYESKKAQYEKKFLKQLRKAPAPTFKKRMLSAVAIAAALMVFAILGEGFLNREWLEGRPSQDLQQYEVTGHEIDLGLIDEGNASSEETEAKEITTSNFDEAVSVLGFTPLMPAKYPDGWTHYTFYAAQSDHFQWFYEAFASDSEEYMMTYQVRRFPNASSAEEYLEQSGLGTLMVCNGWDVYFADNIDNRIAIWIDGLTCYSLSGPIPTEELMAIIDSINKGE